jgi:SecD/SecF fusion protein
MRHTLRYSILTILLLMISVAAIYPPDKNLRKGRDLAGGTTLLYSIEVDSDQPVDQVIDNTIEVLKKRVDPNGLYEISFVRQGQNRIEVTMPLPTPLVQQLKGEYEAALDSLDHYHIDGDAIDRAMRASGDERARQISAIAGANAVIADSLQIAADAYDLSQMARQEYEQAVAEGADDETIDRLINAAGAAADDYQRARADVLAAGFDKNDLAEALRLSDKGKVVIGDEGESITMASPRSRALDRLREENPAIAGEIDSVVAAYDAYEAERRGLDDANDLIRLLSGAGVLQFRIAVQAGDENVDGAMLNRAKAELAEKGDRAGEFNGARWYPLNDIEAWYDSTDQLRSLQADPDSFFANRGGYIVSERDGRYFMLLWDVPGMRLTRAEGDWGLQSAFRTIDDLGRPAIGFTMNAAGAQKLGALTGPNVGKPMAIVLDDEVYSAPNLNSRISSNGIIQGTFSQQDITYLVNTLAAGSLSAKLSDRPISINTISVPMGADNLNAGFTAAIIALIAVAIFMGLYYMGAGMVALIALATNAILILGIMALARASFTLPGIAGIVLTFGMAVDANVLIYERIREELEAGADVKAAVRLGYEKVLSTILDANITNLIVCLVLYYYATQDIRGFAITLGVGIVCTLFSALVVTRLVFTLMLERGFTGWVRFQAPIVIPGLQKALSPTINWLRLRPLFLVISTGYIALGVGMIVFQGQKMLDTEFRGGTAIDISLTEGQTRTRQEVEDLITGAVANVPADSSVAELRTAEIVAVNPAADGITSNEFRIKTIAQDEEAIQGVILGALGDLIATSPPLTFDGAKAEGADAPIYPITDMTLGADIDRPEVQNNVADYLGGVAIVLNNITPAPSLADLENRLAEMRNQPDYLDALGRDTSVVILEGDESAVRSAVVLASEEDLTFFDDEARWNIDLAQEEWRLVNDALTRTTTFAGVQSFDAAVASTFRAQAIVAVVLSFLGIMAYIWFRFGSLRYSMAAIVALVHDVLAVVGLIAMAEIIYDAFPGVASALMIEPFKIDLGLIAALLTIIGYSLNDTIVILDRVRENRGKLDYASAEVINRSINQTISRTLITSGTTMIAVLIMYVVGGTGIRSFTYALLCGVFVGTYSSIAVAAPLVYSKRDSAKEARRHHSETENAPELVAAS